MRAVLAARWPTLLVIAKEPVPGRVKTRLSGPGAPCSPADAARLAEAALSDTLRALSAVPAGRRVLVLEGEPGRWVPPGWEVLPQCGGGLDRRLAHAFGLADPEAPAFLVGMDTPQIGARLVAEPLAPGARRGVDAWYGPAADGGFWALGLARPSAALAERLLLGVPMSTAETGAALLDRLDGAGLTVRHLATLTDVDTAEDAEEVAAAAPETGFAARWSELLAARAGAGAGLRAGAGAGAGAGSGVGVGAAARATAESRAEAADPGAIGPA
ncbi:TIGR04282 family arsenosugar biosynthesis glycosyltransferase [Phaeacidiphilus oryzae]|uniref:TIGR04282 family arsenosugar biosynthesis glycosyltransferase n=1 Tax=Phaeacidiphilus oryzae TaxID=348818 RepID=UPI001F3A4D80|nr:DUF2064 domain-containing protein [Phaeacidiphilus oryzae]